MFCMHAYIYSWINQNFKHKISLTYFFNSPLLNISSIYLYLLVLRCYWTWRFCVKFFLVNVGQVIVGYSVGWSAPILPKLKNIDETPLTDVVTDLEASYIGSLLYIGSMIGEWRLNKSIYSVRLKMIKFKYFFIFILDKPIGLIYFIFY